MASLPIMKSLLLLGLVASFGRAYEPSPMQDFCVAVPDAKAAVFLNGKVCKNPKLVSADDFYLAAGLNTPAGGTKLTSVGLISNFIDVDQFPGLNTMGLSFGRIDFEPNGLIPLHYHPRGSEVVFVLEGTLYVGFVTSNAQNIGKNTLFAKILNPGDAIVFPVGLVHFLYNVGRTNATAFASYNSQKPGFVVLANAVFGPAPPISDDVLAKTFHLEKKVVQFLQAQNWSFT
ncbi:PREDICTED: germin-like protein subfamily 1 member 13 isoform X3 [Ipomoea nil]|uniref:germin-like protein subfamily 1 member 13 isoform X3 n=1 Tax=Ipomoea nil TaxID=35883 RepID=UPI000901580E|nr:PREDICTED: germin-like protein subfamily 1 member 13 isoform X3 [Ipomoea nil]